MRFLVVVLFVCSGCFTAARDRRWLEDEVARRSVGRLDEHAAGMPSDLDLTDGLSSAEAVRIALARSPGLHAELTALDSALADFDEARRPANPRLNFLAPWDPRQFALIFLLPIDAIWQLPFRAKAANLELERVSESLVQLVLDTQRDVRVAHADAMLAQARMQTREEIDAAWLDAARLAEGRARAGDIAPVEAAAVRAEAETAHDFLVRARYENEIAAARLLFVMGQPWPTLPMLSVTPHDKRDIATAEVLMARAFQHRAELRAAELAVHAAGARGKWERSRVVSMMATVDGQAPVGSTKLNFSLGAQQVELPIFGRNPGGIGRADAALTRALERYAHTRNNVAYDVVAARASLLRARQSAATYERIVDAVRENADGSKSAFQSGLETYLVVIDALRRESEVRLRRIDVDAEVLRASAELVRAVGSENVPEAS